MALLLLALPVAAQTPSAAPQPLSPRTTLPTELQPARQALLANHPSEAEPLFRAWLASHPATEPGWPLAELGLGDALLLEDRLEDAETAYRAATAREPRLWQAHRNLVQVEARLGRWESFYDERTLLRGARQRGEPGLDPRESDLIDRFTVAGQSWMVREYFQPVGRSEARYNLTAFSSEGHVLAYLSLEPVDAAAAALTPHDVHIGGSVSAKPTKRPYALNWYNGQSHGAALQYPSGEPTYERLRADTIHWLANPANAAKWKPKRS